MVVLNPRCSLNHLAMLPVHRSQVNDCSLVPPFLPAEPESVRQSGILGSPAASRPVSERVASLVRLCPSGEERASTGGGAGGRERGHRHFLVCPAATLSHTARLLPTSGFQTTQHGSACARGTHAPHNLPSLPENIHCHLPDF